MDKLAAGAKAAGDEEAMKQIGTVNHINSLPAAGVDQKTFTEAAVGMFGATAAEAADMFTKIAGTDKMA